MCTLGPASSDRETVRAMVDAGMDVARINTSYGSPEDHAATIALVADVAGAAGRTVGVLADLQGPKIRLGELDEEIELEVGQRVRLVDEGGSFDGAAGVEVVLPTTYDRLSVDVEPGHRLMIADGLVRLEVQDVGEGWTDAEVFRGGAVRTGRGVNLPDTTVTAPVLDDGDREHLAAALDAGADLIALSFVRRASDADVVRAAMEELGRRAPVIAKIERADAVQDLEAVVQAFDGVMVARGDLGVEIDLAAVPLVQKQIITECRKAATPVIVATEMLESMAHAARPTRAEASDVVNAILDGTDAVMLSGETSIGDHPAEVVATMAHLVEVAETVAAPEPIDAEPDDPDVAVVRAAVDLAATLPDAVLAVLTRTGSTARRASALRPRNRLIVVAPPDGYEAWGVLWGVEIVAGSLSADAPASRFRTVLGAAGDLGDEVVIALAGVQPGRTDVIRRLDPG